MFPLNLYAGVRNLCIIFARETAGAARTGIPRTLFLGGEHHQASGASRRENATAWALKTTRVVLLQIDRLEEKCIRLACTLKLKYELLFRFPFTACAVAGFSVDFNNTGKIAGLTSIDG